MSEFIKDIQVRWSDLDPNFHVRHSAYYDWGAFCRIEFLNAYGLTSDVMIEMQFGPILFREECIFRREIKMGDEIRINLQLLKSRKDFSRWSIKHEIMKGDGQLAAQLTVDGAWINMIQRKLATPPEKVAEVFDRMPKVEGFEWQ